MKNPNRHELIKQAWLRTLSRPPRADETQTALVHVAEAKSLRAGMLDVLWALLNTKEFILNH
jgi:hypothetical protein